MSAACATAIRWWHAPRVRERAERIFAELPPEFVIGDFDVSPNGAQILFDRVQESSELALIERAR